MLEVDGEIAWNNETEKFDRRKFGKHMFECGLKLNPFYLKQKPIFLKGGMRWVGIDYQEPYSEYTFNCKCGNNHNFIIYIPQ